MRKGEIDTDAPAPPPQHEYTINIKKFVEYALDQKKSLKFKVEYNFPPTLYKSHHERLKQEFSEELREHKFMGYINKLLFSKAYLTQLGRKFICKFIQTNCIIEHNMRKKVG